MGAIFDGGLRFALLSAVVAGLVSATGFAPLSLWPLTLAALAVLLHLIANAPTWKHAALLGWLFGVGHFTFGNGWIATAFTYQAEMPTWLGWIAVFALALYLAVAIQPLPKVKCPTPNSQPSSAACFQLGAFAIR